MSNLENLISKILSDCEEKSNQIIGEAEQKASEMIKESTAAAEREKEKIIGGAESDAKKQAEQILVGKKLEIRDSHLGAKRQVIDKVFKLALDKLSNMPKKEFLAFLEKNLLKMDLDGDEIILPSKYEIDINKLNETLKKNGKGSVKPPESKRDITGGFILIKEGIENNNTFEALIDYYRDELESGIIAKLF